MFDDYTLADLIAKVDAVDKVLPTRVPNGWVLIGEVNGKPRYRYTKGDNFRVVKEKSDVTPYAHVRLGPTDIATLKPGCLCPKCSGTGRYKWHDDSSRVEPCYWCTDNTKEKVGKGMLSVRNIAYIQKHLRQDTLYWVHTA